MKNMICIGLIVAASLTAFATDEADDAKVLQGTWIPIKAELGGEPMADAVLKTITLKSLF